MIQGSNKYARAIRRLETLERRNRSKIAPGTLVDVTTNGTHIRSRSRTGSTTSAGQRDIPRWL
jgi:hypothetical protein